MIQSIFISVLVTLTSWALGDDKPLFEVRCPSTLGELTWKQQSYSKGTMTLMTVKAKHEAATSIYIANQQRNAVQPFIQLTFSRKPFEPLLAAEKEKDVAARPAIRLLLGDDDEFPTAQVEWSKSSIVDKCELKSWNDSLADTEFYRWNAKKKYYRRTR